MYVPGNEYGNRLLQVAFNLLRKIPGAYGSAMHAAISAAQLRIFVDEEGKEPLSPFSRIALAAFAYCMVVFQSLAICMGHETTPPVTQYKLTLAANGLTAPTRGAVMNALASVTVNYQIQATWETAIAMVLAAFGTQSAESTFGEGRSPQALNATCALSVGDLVRYVPHIALTTEDQAKGNIILPKSRKAGSHVMHDNSKYIHRVSETDQACAIGYGDAMARELLEATGYGPLLRLFPTLGKATQKYLELVIPASPKVCPHIEHN